jgi:hypothetical protein
MRGGRSAAELNACLRDFMGRRAHRLLTGAEQAEYQRMLADWAAAEQRERLCRRDVVEVA